MVKYFALFVNFSVALFLNFLFQTPVQIGVEVPSTVNAGEAFEVSVTLNKGDITGFARYMQQLPYGLTAVPNESANADFTFKDQKIRLIWLRLAKDDETVTFKYNILVDQRLKGEFNFQGLFSYIENNERKSIGTVSPIINILPNPALPPDEIVDINEFGDAVIQNLTPAPRENVMCIRQAPKLNETKDAYIINILVHKATDRFAKIEETIPNGYTVQVLEERDAIFSYRDNLVKFLWMNLPAEEYFSVSYKLVPDDNITQKMDIKGTFSYIEDDDKTTEVEIIQEDFELADYTPEKIEEVFARLIGGQEITQTLVDTSSIAENNIDEQKDTTKAEESGKRPSFITDNKQNVPQKNKTQTTKRKTQSRYIGKTDLLTPEKGIYYRVQVAAGHNPVNIRRYFRKFNLEKTVKKELHDGWYKYSVGSFKEYKEARDYRNYIWRTTLIDDAFVSAYNEGDRITVQEALMIANQRWYK